MADQAEKVTKVSIFTTTLVGLVEIAAALFSGSVGLIAAGIDALSDTFTSLVVLAGLYISKRPADRGHLYGHAQAETLASMILAVALFVAGVRVASLALEKFYSGLPIEVSLDVLFVAVAAIIISGLLARYKILTGKKVHSLAVVADGYHTLTDAVSAAAVLVGLILVTIGHTWVDPLIAMGISVLIVYWSLNIGWSGVKILMESSPGKKTMDEINRVCLGVTGVRGCHRSRARRVGSKLYADVHINVDPKLSVKKSHAIATRVERNLKAKIPDLTSVVVHIEPSEGRKVDKKR